MSSIVEYDKCDFIDKVPFICISFTVSIVSFKISQNLHEAIIPLHVNVTTRHALGVFGDFRWLSGVLHLD